MKRYVHIPCFLADSRKCSTLGLWSKCVLLCRVCRATNRKQSRYFFPAQTFPVWFFQFFLFFFSAGGRQSLPSVAPPKHLLNPSNISGWTIKTPLPQRVQRPYCTLPEKIHTFLNKSGNTVPINWMSWCYFLRDTQAARGALTGVHFQDCRWLPHNKLSLPMRGRRYFQTSTCRRALGATANAAA